MGGNRFPLNQPVGVVDIIQAFKQSDNEEGTYHILHGGQSHIATARAGASLETYKGVGIRVPTITQPGSTELFWVTKISNQRLVSQDQQADQQQQQFRS